VGVGPAMVATVFHRFSFFLKKKKKKKKKKKTGLHS
jgi:hypothetical protein